MGQCDQNNDGDGRKLGSSNQPGFSARFGRSSLTVGRRLFLL
jgi:hypothetical protein